MTPDYVVLLGAPLVVGGFITGIFIVLGALRMMRLQSHGWAMTASVLALLPCASPIWLLGLAIGIWSLIVLNRRDVRAAFAAQRAKRLGHPLPRMPLARESSRSTTAAAVMEQQAAIDIALTRERARSNSAVLWGVAILVLVLICPLGIAAMLFGSYATTHTVTSVPPQANVDPPPATPDVEAARVQGNWRGWEWGPDGPEVYEPLARSRVGFDFADTDIDEVNRVLQSAHREYLELEQKHRKHSVNDEGHQVTVIDRFPLGNIEDRLWSGLDALFASDEKQRIARLNLKFCPKYRDGQQSPWAMSDLTNPSLLGFCGDPARIEIWRVGSWYHWNVSVMTGPGNFDKGAFASNAAVAGPSTTESGPELPYELRRFWIDPMPEKPPAEKAPAEKVPPAGFDGSIE